MTTSICPLSAWNFLTVSPTGFWVLWYHIGLVFTAQSWVPFSCSCLCLRCPIQFKIYAFLLLWKCNLLSDSQNKKKQIELEAWQTPRSASLTRFSPRRFDKLLYKKAVFWRQNCLPVCTSTLTEGKTPAAWIRSQAASPGAKRALQFQQSEPSSPQLIKTPLGWQIEISFNPVSLHAWLFTANLCPGRSQ